MVSDLLFAKPEQEGLASARVLKFLDRLDERKVNLHAFMIVRHGKILAEGYYKPFDKDFKHRIYSASKTYVATAVGLLIQEGKLRLSDRLSDFFPEYREVEQHKWLQECTVEDALKMAVPMLTDTYYDLKYEQWAWTFFNRQRALKPAGTIFNYNTSASFILDVLVEKITGKPFLEYMRPVFDEIGVSKDIRCVKSPDGFSWGGSGVICTLREFAAFGELLMHGGEHKGKQLLPKEYTRRMTSKRISNVTDNHNTLKRGYGYGYQTWINKFGFGLYGMGSQYVFAFPEKDFMFVCNGDTQAPNDTDGDYIFEQVIHELYENLCDAPVTEDGNYEKLCKRLASLELHTDYGDKHGACEKKVGGIKYVLEENSMGWQWFRLDFERDGGCLTYENRRGVKKIRFGANAFVQGTFPETHYYDEQVGKPANRELNCMAAASWTEDEKLLLRVYIVDTSFGNCFMTFGFKGDEVGIFLAKRAEFFMDDYGGYAGGKRE